MYTLYFTDGGSVVLDLIEHSHPFLLKWIDISSGEGVTKLRSKVEAR